MFVALVLALKPTSTGCLFGKHKYKLPRLCPVPGNASNIVYVCICASLCVRACVCVTHVCVYVCVQCTIVFDTNVVCRRKLNNLGFTIAVVRLTGKELTLSLDLRTEVPYQRLLRVRLAPFRQVCVGPHIPVFYLDADAPFLSVQQHVAICHRQGLMRYRQSHAKTTKLAGPSPKQDFDT